MNPFARILGARREAAGLLRKELADKVGVSTSMIAKIESGWMLPTEETKCLMAKVLELKTSSLGAFNSAYRDAKEFAVHPVLGDPSIFSALLEVCNAIQAGALESETVRDIVRKSYGSDRFYDDIE
jgi:transcriptional regulator with XRE-family HTH domain